MIAAMPAICDLPRKEFPCLTPVGTVVVRYLSDGPRADPAIP